MKVRISDRAFAPKRRKEPKNRLFHKGDFEFWINGHPETKLVYHDMTRKSATAAAMFAAPGCTFHVVQLS